MDKLDKKVTRYRNIFKKLSNWPEYLFKKSTGLSEYYDFKIRHFGNIRVHKKMLGPFKENFFDNIYFKNIPGKYLQFSKKPLFIDIGANVGFFSLAAFAKYPEAEIYAFEPHPFCSAKINEYKSAHPELNWHITNKAVSNNNDKLTLNTIAIDGFATRTSMMSNKNMQKNFTVESIRLDDFIENNGVSQVDFMKIDCEGAEYSILYDLDPTYFTKINSMCIETHKGDKENQNLESLNKFLQEVGYETTTKKEGGYTGYIWAWR